MCDIDKITWKSTVIEKENTRDRLVKYFRVMSVLRKQILVLWHWTASKDK